MTLAAKQRIQLVVRWICAFSFITPGILHFTHADVFVAMMPAFLPWHLELVWLSGVFEILGGVGLLLPFSRRFAAWGLMALLVAVFPANVNMAVNEIGLAGMPADPVLLWARLPFQLVFLAEVWVAGLWEPSDHDAP